MTLDTTPVSARSEIRFEERSRCVACGSTSRDEVWSGRLGDEPWRGWIERHRYSGDPLAALGGERFRLVRCLECSMLFHSRVLSPAGLAQLYGHWIDDDQVAAFEEAEGRRAPGAAYDEARQNVKHLLRLKSLAGRDGTLRVLDFGCGEGRFVRLADALGLEAWGVDASPSRRARARRLGLRVHESVEDARRAGATGLDAVTLIETLEHLVDPRAALDEAASILRPGGALLVEVPDARGIAGPPRSFEELRVVQPLEHVNAFTPATLERICREAGFAPVRRPVAHVTASIGDVVRGALARLLPLRRTSAYFVRTAR
jgi:SAM-dependent methyltransferase